MHARAANDPKAASLCVVHASNVRGSNADRGTHVVVPSLPALSHLSPITYHRQGSHVATSRVCHRSLAVRPAFRSSKNTPTSPTTTAFRTHCSLISPRCLPGRSTIRPSNKCRTEWSGCCGVSSSRESTPARVRWVTALWASHHSLDGWLVGYHCRDADGAIESLRPVGLLVSASICASTQFTSV